MLRAVIAGSAAVTLLYTPLLKRLCLVKNASVAFVIAASPIAGALAAGAVRPPPPSCSAPENPVREKCYMIR